MPTRLVQCVNGRLDIFRLRLGNSHPIRLDVHAQTREEAEVREGVPADDEGPVRRLDRHLSNADAWLHPPSMGRT